MNFRELAEVVGATINAEVFPFGRGIVVQSILSAKTADEVKQFLVENGYKAVVGINPSQTKFYLTPLDN